MLQLGKKNCDTFSPNGAYSLRGKQAARKVERDGELNGYFLIPNLL